MQLESIDLESKISQIGDKPWQPVEIATVNDQVVRLAYMKGEYHWHQHKNDDELFFIIRGNLVIQIKNQDDIILSEGQMVVVPKGIEHCPKSEKGAYVLMFEPQVLQSAGS